MGKSKRKKNEPSTKTKETTETIDQKAIKIFSTDGLIQYIDDDRWSVRSKPDGNKYEVAFGKNSVSCECDYHTERSGARCKHIAAIEMLIMAHESAPNKGKEITLDKPSIQCKKCGSKNCVKNGLSKGKRKDPVQTYKCKECGYRFRDNLGFENRHHNWYVIVLSIISYSIGNSPNSISLILLNMGWSAHPDTIFNWTKEYSHLISKYTDTLQPQVGTKMSTDEKYKRTNGKQCWLFSVLCTTTRFVLSWDTTASKMKYNPVSLFKKAKDVAGFSPRIFVSDGLPSFGKAFKNVFYSEDGPRAIHIKDCHWTKKYCNNNAHERFNGELGDVLHSVRGLKKSDSSLFTLLIIHHNFIRPHMGLNGKTPSEAAGITLKGNKKMLTLIQNAAAYSALSAA